VRALDLFRGAGGWSVACQHLGITDLGVEIMSQANETASAAGHITHFTDAWTPPPLTATDGQIASAPCPTFSLAGKGTGRAALDSVLTAIRAGAYMNLQGLRAYPVTDNDDRTRLVLTPLHYAYAMRPDWVAWEQVPAVLPVWEACAEVLREWGYSVWTGNLQAEQYGVPQTRKRAILIASRVKEVGMPAPTHSRYYPRDPTKLDEGVKKWVSMAEALGWGLSGRPWLFAGAGATSQFTAGQIPRAMDQPAHTITGKATAAWLQERPDWPFERPATTVQGDPRLAAPGHRCMTTDCHPGQRPESQMAQALRVTVQEAGILQSFPADYPWQGAKGKQYLQVGNAIPPLLAEAVLSEATS
jgi:DNA (cytosine-5)-methyltransferase 1